MRISNHRVELLKVLFRFLGIGKSHSCNADHRVYQPTKRFPHHSAPIVENQI